MEELYKFMNQSNATLDLKVGSELATEAPEEGAEPLEVCFRSSNDLVTLTLCYMRCNLSSQMCM